jgi:hypothetical protein
VTTAVTSSTSSKSSNKDNNSNNKSNKYLIGHASACITLSEYFQNCNSNINQPEKIDGTMFNTEDNSLLLNVSIFKSGKKYDNRFSSTDRSAGTNHRNSIPADTIVIDILRQQHSTSSSEMKHDHDENNVATAAAATSSSSSSSHYEYIHQQTLYWPDANRSRPWKKQYTPNFKEKKYDENCDNINYKDDDDDDVEEDNNQLTRTTGPCSLLLQNNPFLQLFHHIVHPPWMPSPSSSSSSFVPLSSNPSPNHSDPPSSSSDTTTTTTMRNTTNTNNNQRTGLIAVTFVRIPQQPYHNGAKHDNADHDNDDGNKSKNKVTAVEVVDDTPISTADAIDVLNLLSLQSSFDTTTTINPLPNDTVVSVSERRHNVTTATNTTTPSNNAEINSAMEQHSGQVETELLLACLTNDGKVFLYSPWKLLFHGTKDTDGKNSNDGSSFFWFGGGSKNIVHNDNVLPLRECIISIELSIPYLSKGQQQKESESWSNHHSKKQRPPPSSIISMFDASMWDATLDPTTLHHQTIHNVPTHCTSAHDEYICIAGRGQKRWYYDERNSANDHNGSTIMNNAVNSNDENSFGGFVTFIATSTMSEKRTLFLPFVPEHVSPLYWGDMKLILITGQGHAVAIRLDGGSTIVPAMPLSSSEPCNCDDAKLLQSPKKETTVSIHRFQILPIEFSNVETSMNLPSILGADVRTSPPAIVLMFDDDLNQCREGVYVVRQTFASFEVKKSSPNYLSDYQHRPNTASTVVITTNPHDIPTAYVPLIHAASSKVWCQLGQGSCIVGSGRKSFFVCYEGSNKEIGPTIEELSQLDLNDGDVVIHNSVLPSALFNANHQLNRPLQQHKTSQNFCIVDQTRPSNSADGNHDARSGNFPDYEVIDDIILEAMENISSLTHRENFGSNSPTSVTRRNRQLSLTTQEKSERLLRHCSSWTKLDQSFPSMSIFQSQTPSVTLRTDGGKLSILTLRSIVIEHGPAVPFQQVLAWLSMQMDYFTAASIALKLLQDDETLRHLWLTYSNLDHNEKYEYLDGLLDGILAIDTDSEDTATMTHLADMTVACLTKGGYAMSSTLEQFLSRNMIYDPSRASLMLAASAVGTLSDDEMHVTRAMGSGYSCGPNHVDCILWPVRCLLKIGVARNRIGTVLLLLNTTIPDELRRRTRFGSRAVTQPSLELCKSLVMLIVGTAPDSTEILLDLVDERSRLRFWESLDHETRLELSVITMTGFYPLLRDVEIRSWILAELQKCVESEDLASAVNVYVRTPSEWLRTVTLGCLRNAGCNMELLLRPTLDETKEDVVDNCGFYKFRETVHEARRAVKSTEKTGGLDFDIVIPALLVLDHRQEVWHQDAESSTRTVLNAVCYQAGRSEVDEPLFVMNSVVVMRQCVRLGDVEAGAHLIGGKNGFILQICHTLNEALGCSVEDAERYALNEASNLQNQGLMETFTIRDCHRRLLLLLDEHVLKIRTYGEFAESRGTVDPVFAATLFFRTWWIITIPILTEATQWLTDWLRQQLHLSIMDKNAMSPHRLTCAALIQALIWPQVNDRDKSSGEALDTTPLANKFEMDGVFLFQLARSCCGMVEALPPNVLESSESNGTNAVIVKSSITPNSKRMVSPNDTSINNRSEYDVDDSFVSAVGTYRDMDISHTTWNT